MSTDYLIIDLVADNPLIDHTSCDSLVAFLPSFVTSSVC